MHDLQQLRDQIDRLDDELIALLAQRQAIVRAVAEYKVTHGLQVHDAAREHYLHDLHQQLSVKHGVSFSFLKSLFAMIITESKRLQEACSKDLKNADARHKE